MYNQTHQHQIQSNTSTSKVQVEEEEIDFVAVGMGSHGEQRFHYFFTWATNTTFKVFPRYSFTLEFYLPIRKDFTYELTDREVRHQNSAKTKQFTSIICKGSDQTDEKGTRLVAKAPLWTKEAPVAASWLWQDQVSAILLKIFSLQVTIKGMRARRRRRTETSHQWATRTCWGQNTRTHTRNCRKGNLVFSTNHGASTENPHI